MEWPLQAYSVKLRRKVDIAEDSMELVTMKNGRHAVRGVAAEDQSINLFRFLGNAEVDKVQANIHSARTAITTTAVKSATGEAVRLKEAEEAAKRAAERKAMWKEAGICFAIAVFVLLTLGLGAFLLIAARKP